MMTAKSKHTLLSHRQENGLHPLTGTQKTVFDCILNRFCAVFCEEACTVDHTTIVIHCNDEDFTLKGDVQVTPGWRKFEKPTSGDKLLPKLNKGDAVNINFKTVGEDDDSSKRYTVEALNNWMVAPDARCREGE